MENQGLGRHYAKSPLDLIGGLFMCAIAALALYLVNDLPASGRVGFASGTAPRLFAYGLGGLGLWIAVAGFFKSGPGIDYFNWRGILTILGSVLFFAIVIRTLGLAVTGVPMVVLASFAARDGRLVESVIFGSAITFFCCLLFPGVLGQPIPLWPQF
jgi:putative tricarboxylic transport membrane protein